MAAKSKIFFSQTEAVFFFFFNIYNQIGTVSADSEPFYFPAVLDHREASFCFDSEADTTV